MREIKFRAWDEETNEMVSWEDDINVTDREIDIKNKCVMVHVYNSSPNEPDYTIESHNAILMQYTGLKDKNGKEIYEGDIVKRTEKTNCCNKEKLLGLFEVVFEGYSFLAKNNHYHFLGWAGDDEREVIGNIHDNPELMEATDGKEEENN